MIRILQIETDTEEKAEDAVEKGQMSQKLILLLSLKKSRAAAGRVSAGVERYIKCFGGDGFFSGTGSDQRNYFLGREILYSKMHIGL